MPILTEITDYQATVVDEEKKQKQIEIDILGKNGKNILLVGECILRRPSATDAMTSGQSATLTATPYEVPFN